MKSDARPLVKVQRVRSADEAMTLERLGVDIIGVSLAPEHGAGLFDDDRALSVAAAEAVGQSLTRARLALALADPVTDDAAEVLDLARRCAAAHILVPAFDLPAPAVTHALAAARIGLIVGRLDASHDDDPGWILSPLDDLNGELDEGLDDASAVTAEVQLLPDHDGAWHFLTTECPKFPDDLQLADIEALAHTRSLLVSVDATPGNVHDILQTLPSIQGISLTLGTLTAGRYDVHVIGFDDAAAVVRTIRSHG